MDISAIIETKGHLLPRLSPRQQFKIYGTLCSAVFSVIEVDRNGAGLEMFYVGKSETASPKQALELLIPALLGGCPQVGRCPLK